MNDKKNKTGFCSYVESFNGLDRRLNQLEHFLKAKSNPEKALTPHFCETPKTIGYPEQNYIVNLPRGVLLFQGVLLRDLGTSWEQGVLEQRDPQSLEPTLSLSVCLMVAGMMPGLMHTGRKGI